MFFSQLLKNDDSHHQIGVFFDTVEELSDFFSGSRITWKIVSHVVEQDVSEVG